MSNQIGELDLVDAAEEMAGNWQSFKSFVWDRDDIEDKEKWAIVYTHNRDSRLLDLSNASVYEQTMKRFAEGDDPDVVFESHNHWAVGHVDGFSIRVYRNGEITDAFKAYHALAEREANYPILDESNYSERECEATYENLDSAAWRLKNSFELPEDWRSDVIQWFDANDSNALESRDDQGGYPDEKQLRAAFEGLGYVETEE